MRDTTSEALKLRVDAVIFDLDGTLIDSLSAYFRTLDEIFKRLDLPPVSREVIIDVMRDTDGDWGDLFPDADKKDELSRESLAIFEEIYPSMFKESIKMIPGIDGMLNRISTGGMKIGIVTSTHKRYLESKLFPLKQAGITQLFESVITIEDTPRCKPEPDPLNECMKSLGLSPSSQSVYVGDSFEDIMAGKAAGMKTVGVLTGLDDYETLKNEDPDVIIDSVVDLSDVIHFS